MTRVVFAFLVATALLPGEEIRTGRPLLDIADRLQAAWARPVTYEEPLLQFSEDLAIQTDRGLETVIPRPRLAHLSTSALANRDRSQDAANVQSIVADYNLNNPALTFSAIEDGYGLHLIPVSNRDANGRLVQSHTALDEKVRIPIAGRMPLEHVSAITQALSGILPFKVQSSSWLLGFGFHRLFLQAEMPDTFTWGTPGYVPARTALGDLMMQSATTMTWRLNCQPATVSAAPFCVLNVGPLAVDTKDSGGLPVRKTLRFDRCARCPASFPPPPSNE